MTVIYLLLLLVIPFEYFDVNEIHFANINIILFIVFFLELLRFCCLFKPIAYMIY